MPDEPQPAQSQLDKSLLSPTPDFPPVKPRTPWWQKLLGFLRWTLAVVVLVAGVAVYADGVMVLRVLAGLVWLGAALAVPVRLWCFWRKSLAVGWQRRPGAPENRRYLVQFLVRVLFWLMATFTVMLIMPRAVFVPREYSGMLAITWGLALLLVAAEAVPRKPVYLAPNVVFGIFALLLAVECGRICFPSGGVPVVVRPPLSGEWNVFHGGRSPWVNHHWLVPAQQHALDLDRDLNGPPAKSGDVTAYAAWSQPIYAPADGVVVRAEALLPDNGIGQTDEKNLVGNHLVIDIGSGKYALLAHLRQGSLLVGVGFKVKAGQEVAACGNSGNTSEPHLHFQIQSLPDFEDPRLRTFPIRFQEITRVRGGGRETGTFEVRRNDRIVAPVPTPGAAGQEKPG